MTLVSKEITLCRLEIPKWVFWQTVKTQMKMSRNATFYLDLTLGTEVHILLEIFTCDPLICIMNSNTDRPYMGGENRHIQCIHLCFCMLAISFYFVNCVIISCKLSFNSRFTRNQNK